MAKSFKSMFAESMASQTYRDTYHAAGESFPLKDVEDLYAPCVEAKCVERDAVNADGEMFHSRSICLVMNSGNVKYIPCTKDSLLSDGDKVDKDSIMVTPLERGGDVIYRADGMKI